MRNATVPLLLIALTASPLAAASPNEARTYLIMPFENVAEDPSLDWMSTCIAFSFGEYLSGFGVTVIEDDERAVLYEGSGLPSGAPLTIASSLQLGRKMRGRAGEIGPDRMILGKFLVNEGALTIDARTLNLVRESFGEPVAREGRLKDLLKMQYTLVATLAHEEGLRAPDSRGAMFNLHADELPLLAHETYCRAMAETNPKKRLRLLRRAVDEFPGYPKAVFQATDLLVGSERWGDAATLIESVRAAPHPYEEEFYILSATVALERGQPQEASKAARRALEYSGSVRGYLLLASALIGLEDFKEARAAIESAESIDSTNPQIAELRRTLQEEAEP